MSELQHNLSTTIHLEALKLTTTPVIEQLASKIQHIESQYKKELSENEFKALQRNEQFIRLILSLINDYDATLNAIGRENQQLRAALECAVDNSEMWRLEYIEQGKQNTNLIDLFQSKLKALNAQKE